jgi:hypothetical protein
MFVKFSHQEQTTIGGDIRTLEINLQKRKGGLNYFLDTARLTGESSQAKDSIAWFLCY